MRIRHSLLFAALVWSLVAPHVTRADDPSPTPLAIGSRRELFIDDALIDKLSGGAQQRLHSPEPRELSLKCTEPWEGSGSGYFSVFRDGKRFRMYYRASQLDVVDGKFKTDDHPIFICYAESDDGVTWRKPQLGLYEFRGSKANNIVLAPELLCGTTADLGHPAFFLDENPQASADGRYKAIFGSHGKRGLIPYQSPDGLHWKPMSQSPVVTHGAFDSQNLAFWDPHLGAYRAYWRYFTGGTTNDTTWKPGGARAIRTAISSDLLTWTGQADLTYVDSPLEHMYGNGVKPYHRAPHLLLGLPTRYANRRSPESTAALPDRDIREKRGAINPRYGNALTETQLMVSRDGVHFKRWNESFMRPGPERQGTWNYGHLYTAWHLLETNTALGAGPELSFYSTEGYWSPLGTSLRRYALRLDGFVSVGAPRSGGELLTKPFTFTGKALSLNFATSAAGSIRVELQSEGGQPLPGFTLADCPEIFGDTVDRKVPWPVTSDLAPLAGKPVRLRFVLDDADLFAFRFE